MDEQVTWKGQSFTLLVFGGIVFLCSVFFVLGMLVGRGQGKSAAESAAVAAAAKAADSDARKDDVKPAIAPYQTITTGKVTDEPARPSAAHEPEPAKTSTPAAEKIDKTAKATPKAPASPPEPAKASAAATKTAPAKTPAPTPVKMIYLQVAALEKDSAADKKVEELRKQGFPAVSMSGGGGATPLYRVQVGPFASPADADTAKRKLEALGYKPIRK